MIHSVSIADINKQFNRLELFELFKQQLAKDFLQCGYPIDFVDTLTADFAHVQESIMQVLIHNENRADLNIATLLYRIDISDSLLKDSLRQNSMVNPMAIIAELIIIRILQKVVVKHYYKNK